MHADGEGEAALNVFLLLTQALGMCYAVVEERGAERDRKGGREGRREVCRKWLVPRGSVVRGKKE